MKTPPFLLAFALLGVSLGIAGCDNLPPSKPLSELTRFFCGPDLEVEVQLVLKQKQVPQFDVGKDDPAGPRLGWFTWIRSGTDFDRSPGDTVLLLGRQLHACHPN